MWSEWRCQRSFPVKTTQMLPMPTKVPKLSVDVT